MTRKLSASSTLALYAPLSEEVQGMVASRFPALRVHLAGNPALTPGMWESLYGPDCPAPLAERLLWRRSLSQEQVGHALSVRSESRKAPLAALLASVSTPPPVGALLRLCRPGMSSQLANLLVTSSRTPREVKLAAAPYAAFKVGAVWALREHRQVPDGTLLGILRNAPAGRQMRWSVLPGLLLDRPRLRRLLVSEPLVPTTAWMLAVVGLRPADQLPFLDRVGEGGLTASWKAALIAEVYLHPATTREVVDEIRSRAATSSLYARAVASASGSGADPLGWGQDPARVTSRRRIETLISSAHSGTGPFGGPVRAWHLAALAANPRLVAEDRERLADLLSSRTFEDALANCARPAAGLARTGSGDLVPPTMWRIETSTGRADTLYGRLGEPAGTSYVVDGEGANLRMQGLSWDPWASREAASYVAQHLGSDVAAWEVAFSLADDFTGTAAELVSACQAIMS